MPSSVALARNSHFGFFCLFVAVPKSHEKACSVKLIKTIEVEGRVGRRDP